MIRKATLIIVGILMLAACSPVEGRTPDANTTYDPVILDLTDGTQAKCISFRQPGSSESHITCWEPHEEPG